MRFISSAGFLPVKLECSVNFSPFSRLLQVEWVLNGTWDSKLEGSKVINESVVKGKSSLECGPSRLLWRVNPIPPEAEKYYFFSKFACELNELEDNVAPTDSRLRPDQRMMEETFWDEANEEKLRLEEKQRTVKKCIHGRLPVHKIQSSLY